ncbi:MAG: enoyl-CoA hydratase/isomerase family protein [Spongiibacteraceae bacterium]
MSELEQQAPVLFESLNTNNGKQLVIATLNAEKTLNSLSLEMVDLLYTQLLAWQQDDNIVAVLLQGAGQKAFCAGGDVQQLYHSSIENPGGPCEYAETFFAREYRLDYLIHSYNKPIICWGHGIVMGGGLGLAAGCSHRVVTEKTRMAMPEITIGLYPDVGGSWFLNHAPGRTGLYLALTAASMNAADCLFVSYADYFIEHAAKASTVERLLSLDWSANKATDAVKIDQLLTAIGKEHEAAKPQSNIATHFDVIQSLTDHDSLSAIVAAITSYETDDAWLNKGAAALAHGSKLSAANIYQALNLTKTMTLAEVFAFELILSTNIVRHPEFAEGVRALLIDKDQQPKWLYDTVEAVPAELLQQMITAPWPQNPLADL